MILKIGKKKCCARCDNWLPSEHVGHNIGFCEIKRFLTSRFSEITDCIKNNIFRDRGYEIPEVIYGFKLRAKILSAI